MPEEFNFVLIARHPDFAKVQKKEREPFRYDYRFLAMKRKPAFFRMLFLFTGLFSGIPKNHQIHEFLPTMPEAGENLKGRRCYGTKNG